MFNLPRLKKGFSMIELLVVMFLIAFMIAFLTIVFVNSTRNAKITAAHTVLHKLDVALHDYYAVFNEYPPDSGYGLTLGGGTTSPGTTLYDSGSLYRYLGKQLIWNKPTETGGFVNMGTFGPFIQHFTDKELKAYSDPVWGDSYQIIDPWQKEIGYIGSKGRVIHNRDGVDLFSCGPDKKTASDIKEGKAPGVDPGVVSTYDYKNQAYSGDAAFANATGLGWSILNGCLTAYKKQSTKKIGNTDPSQNETLDDINNWDPE